MAAVVFKGDKESPFLKKTKVVLIPPFGLSWAGFYSNSPLG